MTTSACCFTGVPLMETVKDCRFKSPTNCCVSMLDTMGSIFGRNSMTSLRVVRLNFGSFDATKRMS